jgi:hypothetical protein
VGKRIREAKNQPEGFPFIIVYLEGENWMVEAKAEHVIAHFDRKSLWRSGFLLDFAIYRTDVKEFLRAFPNLKASMSFVER